MDELTGSQPPAAAGVQPQPSPAIHTCPSCGRATTFEGNFCPYCGAATRAAAAARLAEGLVPWTLLDMAKAIGFVIAGLVVAAIPLVIAILIVVGRDADEADPTYLTINLGWSAVLQALMLLAAVRFGIGKYHLRWSALGFRRPERGGYWLPFPLVMSAFAAIYTYFAILGAFGVKPDTELKGAFDNIGPVVAIAILSLVIAPVVEETFFRGYIFAGLRARWGVLAGAVGSGLLFGLVHASNPGAFYIVPPIAIIGGMFAWAYFYSGSLFASIGAHFLFNLTSFIIGISTR